MLVKFTISRLTYYDNKFAYDIEYQRVWPLSSHSAGYEIPHFETKQSHVAGVMIVQ